MPLMKIGSPRNPIQNLPIYVSNYLNRVGLVALLTLTSSVVLARLELQQCLRFLSPRSFTLTLAICCPRLGLTTYQCMQRRFLLSVLSNRLYLASAAFRAAEYQSRSIYLYSRNMATLKRKAGVLTASDLKKPKKDASLTSFFGAPKSSAESSLPDAPLSQADPVKFDKERWVSGLTEEQKKLLKLEIETLHPSWLAHLREDVVRKDFLELKRFLQKEIDSGKTIFPPLEEVYSW